MGESGERGHSARIGRHFAGQFIKFDSIASRELRVS
jgi:hypothetical protein